MTGVAIMAIVLVLMPAPALAARAEMVLSQITGRVEVATAANPEWQPAVAGMTLRAEDKLRTGADGVARVSYPDAELRVTPDATVVLGYTSVRMQVGTTWVRMRKSGRTFEILTPTVAVTIRGTLVRTTTGAGGASVHLLTGKIDVKIGGVVERLEPRMQIVAPVSGAALVSRIDGQTLVKLMGEYGDLTQGKATSSAVGPPPPKAGSGGGSGSGGAPGGAGGAPGGKASAGGDAGQKALAAGLQGIERDLDARSTGMGVGGGSEAAFDGPAGTSPVGQTGAGMGGGSSFAYGTQSRTLVSRPGGAGAVPGMGTGGSAGGAGGAGGGMGAGGGAGAGGAGAGGGGAGAGGGRGSDGNSGVGGGVGGGRENNRGRGNR